jgi:hypothetical protein
MTLLGNVAAVVPAAASAKILRQIINAILKALITNTGSNFLLSIFYLSVDISSISSCRRQFAGAGISLALRFAGQVGVLSTKSINAMDFPQASTADGAASGTSERF